MQTDFREERRWKIAVAYELALCVQEWHISGSHEERLRLGIIGKLWRPNSRSNDNIPAVDDDQVMIIPHDQDAEENDSDNGDEDSEDDVAMPDADERIAVNAAAGSVSDNEEEEAQERAAVNNALDPDVALADALDEAERNPPAPTEAAEVVEQETPSMATKIEELENANVLQLVKDRDGDISMDGPREAENAQAHEVMKAETLESTPGLKEASSNPTLDSVVGPSDVQELPSKEQKPMLSAEDTKRLRSSLASLPEETLFVSLDQLLSISEEELLKSFVPDEDPSKVPEWDPCAIFPEMQAFGMMDVSTSDIVGGPSISSSDGRRRSDKKVDRDDPSRRIDETVYNKLYPASRFMTMKPTLVSALQPARKWKKGKWVDLDESPVVSDVDAPLPPISSETTCCKLQLDIFAMNWLCLRFDSALFGNRRVIAINNTSQQQAIEHRGDPRFSRHSNRISNVVWSPGEDDLLRTLHERYPGNWRLVADALNSSRIRTSVDLRTPREVRDRWQEKFAPPRPSTQPSGSNPGIVPLFEEGSSTQPAPSSSAMLPPPTPSASSVASTPQMTTRGIQRKATNAAQAALNLTINTGSNTVENRKRKRHNIIHESMRKSATKRSRLRRQDEGG